VRSGPPDPSIRRERRAAPLGGFGPGGEMGHNSGLGPNTVRAFSTLPRFWPVCSKAKILSCWKLAISLKLAKIHQIR